MHRRQSGRLGVATSRFWTGVVEVAGGSSINIIAYFVQEACSKVHVVSFKRKRTLAEFLPGKSKISLPGIHDPQISNQIDAVLTI